jgi:hypothetical protein
LLAVFDDAEWMSPSPGGVQGTLGDGIATLWTDTWIHADDIRHSLGQPSMTGNGIEAAHWFVAQELAARGWPGTMPAVTHPEMLDFILAATGRGDGTRFGTNAPLDVFAG